MVGQAFSLLALVGILLFSLAFSENPASESDKGSAHGVPQADGLEVHLEWYRTVFGEGIGRAGINIADLEGNGTVEIVTSADVGHRHDYWYVLSHDDGAYVQSWVSYLMWGTIRCIRLANVDGDGDIDIVIGRHFNTGTIENEILVYDGTTRELMSVIDIAANQIHDLVVSDVDSDGALEYVVCNDQGLYIYDVATGEQEYEGDDYQGIHLAVGNVDADEDLEIVIANTSWGIGYVLNGQTRAVEWAYPQPGFGSIVRAGDLDGDGFDEIACAYNSVITIFDVDSQTPKFDVPVENGVHAMKLEDVDGNGSLEIVYGDSQWGSLYVYNGQTGVLMWSVPNPENDVSDLAVGDTDDDGTNELVWAGNPGSSAAKHLFIVGTDTHDQEWQSEHLDGPFYALDHGDVDVDGQPEIIYGCYFSDSGDADGLYFIHNAQTKAMEYQSDEPTDDHFGNPLRRIRNANVDDDPQDEIFISTRRSWQPVIICYDGLSHEVQWESSTNNHESLYSMDIADVDGDGELEVIGGSDHVYVYDARTGAEEWISGDLDAALTLLRVGNIDNDDALEIVAGGDEERLYVFDGVTHVNQMQTLDLDITALDLADNDHDGMEEIFIGTESLAIHILDPDTGDILETIGTYEAGVHSRLDALNVLDINGDSIADYVFAISDQIQATHNEIFICNGMTPSKIAWSSGMIGYLVGKYDSMMVADIDEDDTLEIVVNVGGVGFMVYEIILTPVAQCSDDDGDGKVAICHNGHTISVSVNAVAAHLGHGDECGPCG